MADIVDATTRARMMSGIKGKDTAPEMLVRRYLHGSGFRFRLHVAGLPGKPDIVLTKWRAAIQVHGCFWHRHAGCRYQTFPSTRADFWQAKFDANVRRDKANMSALLALGWRVATVWECALKETPQAALAELSDWIRSDRELLEIGDPISS
jgi:DNA mismatch endonuclease (patch repair protein)